MVFDKGKFQAVMTGSEEQRVEALRQLLDYPVKEKDSEGSRFWYLRPGNDLSEAEETCPIAVGFFAELNKGTKKEIEQWLTEDEQDKQIRGHYTRRIATEQPVMYVLLPEGNSQGHVALVLPNPDKLHKKDVLVMLSIGDEWHDVLSRLTQNSLGNLRQRISDTILGWKPQIDFLFVPVSKTRKELAIALAEISREIEQHITLFFKSNEKDTYLHDLLDSFKKELLPNLKASSDNDKDYSFADIYAQTISYGLFTARIFKSVKNGENDEVISFDLENAIENLPETNPFLKQLFKDLSRHDLEVNIQKSIAKILMLLQRAEMKDILTDFIQKLGQEDIVIRFYEDFLAAYKPTMRERRGVYYTPEPVVSYMVRSVDELIKEKFDKPLGIADPGVMILDPACGTGTFLLWIFKLIYERHQANPEAFEYSDWNDYVDHCLLPRIFGFELLMAPYAICHLKLGLFLEESGYPFKSGQRLGVYLINTLEDIKLRDESQQLKINIPEMEEMIAQEARAGSRVKKQEPIMVVIGNPPYSVSSENTGSWILKLIEDYKKDLSEKKLNLDDDYIKFIRFAQWQIDKTGYGILAFISNNSYLAGLTHRCMRKSLLQSFNDIYILDLHGNSKKRERCLDGSPDENIFDIQQGTSVGFFLKDKFTNSIKSIRHCDFFGTRTQKYEDLMNEDISITNWNYLQEFEVKTCLGELFLFTPKEFKNIEEYCKFIGLRDIFSVYQNGLKTDRDELFFDFNKEALENRIKLFYSEVGISEDFRKKYKVEKSSSYDLILKRKNTVFDVKNLQQCLYRPFDVRWLYYSVGLTSRPAWQVMQHMIENDNLALITTRQTSEDWSCFATRNLCGHKSCAAYDINSLFPLYLKAEKNSSQITILEDTKINNFSHSLLNKIKLNLSYLPTAEAIFYYIYAIFHSPTYRTRYAEFLKIDFPRVPLTSDDRLFRQLADYGEQLVGLHLMTSPTLDNLITKFTEQGDKTVAPGHPKYANGKVTINKQGDSFVGVPEEVWNFYVGGYQVCQKWLKDRKERVLSDEDILHYQKIVVALQETIKLMQSIDKAIPSWPIE